MSILLSALRTTIIPWLWRWLGEAFSKHSRESRTVSLGIASLLMGVAVGVFEVVSQLSQGAELNLESPQLLGAGGAILWGLQTIYNRLGTKKEMATAKEEILTKLEEQKTTLDQKYAGEIESLKDAARRALEAAERLEKST